jgi:2-polyprenyl-3-methyl-5-hydroxy-6-metoxy-1,4-benzoquinol methylase
MVQNVHSHAEELERIEEFDFWSKVKLKLILGLVEGQTVLDVGCGSGLLSKALLSKGYSVVAIDDDPKAVEITKKKGITSYVASINDWGISEKFDCIICADVLEHIDNDQEIIKKIYSMLNPNGCLIVNVPSYQFLFGQHDIALGHKRRYSNRELKNKLQSSGFKIEHLRHWNLLTMPMTLLTKINNKDYPHEKVSNIRFLSRTLEKLLLLETKTNHLFGISILCKARKSDLNFKKKPS